MLIDGEHYAPVVRDALAELPYDVVAALLVGGTEKLRGGEDYGVPLVDSLDAVDVDVVVDLSDEPVLGPRERMLWASRALALGLPYVGADFRFEPPAFEPVDVPSLAVIGVGKRIGKTAVTGHVARVLSRDRRVVVVAMGRGGPAEPELIETPPTLDDLLALARAGRHAASDHLETAALAGVPTVGCRRAGGGLAGAPFADNVVAGARLAASLDPDLVVFDGSGAALPPVAADARILVVNGAHDVRAGLNAYRVLISDLVVDTGGADRDAIADDRRRPGRLRRAAPRADGTARRPPHRGVHDRPRADRPPRRRGRPRLAQPREPRRAARRARDGRRRGLSRRAEGGRDRRRRRARARARRRGRARAQRRRLAGARRAVAESRNGEDPAPDDRAAPDHAAARSEAASSACRTRAG